MDRSPQIITFNIKKHFDFHVLLKQIECNEIKKLVMFRLKC